MEEQTTSESTAVRENKKRDYLLPVSIVIAAVLVSVSLIYSAGKKPGVASNPSANNLGGNIGSAATGIIQPKDISLSGVPFMGKSDAPVTIIEYSDYQCPYCARFFSQTAPQIKSEYIDAGKVKFFYKDLAFLGPESVSAAEAAQCAQDQGKFWEFHDMLFNTEINEAQTKGSSENSGNLTRAFFLSIAKTLGMDSDTFASCFDSGKYKDMVQKEASEASAVITTATGDPQRVSTPTFFLNNQLVQGAQPYSAFKQMIDAALAK